MPRQTSPERVQFGDKARATLVKDVREGVTWQEEIAATKPVTFELREPGHVRILRGGELERRTKQATEGGDMDLAKRLSLILIAARVEDSHRLAFPALVMDRLFGVGTHADSVVMWGRGEVIELWSTERWAEAVESTLSDGSSYLSEA